MEVLRTQELKSLRLAGDIRIQWLQTLSPSKLYSAHFSALDMSCKHARTSTVMWSPPPKKPRECTTFTSSGKPGKKTKKEKQKEKARPEPRLAPLMLKVHLIYKKEDPECMKLKKGHGSVCASLDFEDDGLEILGDMEDEGSSSESSSDGEEGQKAGKAVVDTDDEAELGVSPLLL